MADSNVARSSRRSIIAAAAGAAGAFVANAISRPAPAAAGTGTMVYGVINDSGIDDTGLTSVSVGGLTPTLMVQNTASSDGVALRVLSVGSIGIYGESERAGFASVYGTHSSGGYGVIGDTTSGSSLAGVWGRHMGGTTSTGVYGTSAANAGVFGYAGANQAPASVPALTGVYGYSPAGVGVRAKSDTGTALVVAGKARFSRSGKAYVAANATYVDVTPVGGIGTTTVVTATIQTYRAGVAVSGARLNYPSTGVVRIYLTKVASTTGVTPVGWIATEY
jgi:hypothetical protein